MIKLETMSIDPFHVGIGSASVRRINHLTLEQIRQAEKKEVPIEVMVGGIQVKVNELLCEIDGHKWEEYERGEFKGIQCNRCKARLTVFTDEQTKADFENAHAFLEEVKLKMI